MIERRAWCVFLLWYGSTLAIRQKHNISQVAFMMLITGALGLWREHKKHIISLLCCAHKKKKKKKKAATEQWCFCLCFCVHFRSAPGFWNHKLSILSCEDSRPPLPMPHTVLYSGKLLSPETRPGPACILLTPDSRIDPTQPAGSGERVRSAPAGVCVGV